MKRYPRHYILVIGDNISRGGCDFTLFSLSSLPNQQQHSDETYPPPVTRVLPKLDVVSLLEHAKHKYSPVVYCKAHLQRVTA